MRGGAANSRPRKRISQRGGGRSLNRQRGAESQRSLSRPLLRPLLRRPLPSASAARPLRRLLRRPLRPVRCQRPPPGDAAAIVTQSNTNVQKNRCLLYHLLHVGLLRSPSTPLHVVLVLSSLCPLLVFLGPRCLSSLVRCLSSLVRVLSFLVRFLCLPWSASCVFLGPLLVSSLVRCLSSLVRCLSSLVRCVLCPPTPPPPRRHVAINDVIKLSRDLSREKWRHVDVCDVIRSSGGEQATAEANGAETEGGGAGAA